MSDELPEDQAEVSEGVFTFRGKTLEKFSFDRQAAAQRIGDDSGAENDALAVYLCMTPIQKVRQLRGRAAITAFLAEVAEWCDREGITILRTNKGRQEISRIVKQFEADMEKSDFSPDIPKGTKAADPNATG